MTYFIVSTPKTTPAKTIYTSIDGDGYVKDDELHLESATVHYVYKFKGDPIGWYMRNKDTGVDHFLGTGASPTINLVNPTINLVNPTIKSKTYWSEITYEPTNNAEE